MTATIDKPSRAADQTKAPAIDATPVGTPPAMNARRKKRAADIGAALAAQASRFLPHPFEYVQGKGVCKVVAAPEPEDEDEEATGPQHQPTVNTWIWFNGQYRNDAGGGWGASVGLIAPDGTELTVNVDAKLFTDVRALRAYLGEFGVRFSAAKGADMRLLELFSLHKPPVFIRHTEKIGWRDDFKTYVLPGRTIGGVSNERVIYRGHGGAFSTSGTLGEWQTHVADLCKGNRLPALALGVAFAGPLLRLLNIEGGGLHLVGHSSCGKSTTAKVGLSPWEYTAQLPTWKATDNGLEGRAVGRNDNLMVLDESHSAHPEALYASSYMLSNGAGKQRARPDGTGKETATWRTMILSTGETSIATAIASGKSGRTQTAGQEVRIADLPADVGKGYGAFDTIHGRADAATFATELNNNVARYHGTAGPAYVEWIIGHHDEAIATVRKALAAFDALVEREDGDVASGGKVNPQVGRVAKRFGLIYAALAIACKAKVLDWTPHEFAPLIVDCYKSWLANRATKGSSEAQRAAAAINGFIATHGARFENVNCLVSTIHNRAGYYKTDFATVTSAAGVTKSKTPTKITYYFFPSAFKEACNGLEPSDVAKHLDKAGRLVKNKNDGNQYRVRLPGTGLTRVYAVEVIP